MTPFLDLILRDRILQSCTQGPFPWRSTMGDSKTERSQSFSDCFTHSTDVWNRHPCRHSGYFTMVCHWPRVWTRPLVGHGPRVWRCLLVGHGPRVWGSLPVGHGPVMEPFLIGFLQTRYPRLGNYKTFPTVYLPLKSDLKWPQTKSAKRPNHYRSNSNDSFMIKGGNSINRYGVGSLPRYKTRTCTTTGMHNLVSTPGSMFKIKFRRRKNFEMVFFH